MRKFYVVWDTWIHVDGEDGPIKEKVILNEGEKANPETFAKKIRATLNPYGVMKCYASDIIAWSLIEE